jgi:hypothetical protein
VHIMHLNTLSSHVLSALVTVIASGGHFFCHIPQRIQFSGLKTIRPLNSLKGARISKG